ncbi:MAG: ribonuclease P protein component [Calditrichaeota bacterium]|nr:MAG: ribonuclease P protein component [Calditrichota bacterium]
MLKRDGLPKNFILSNSSEIEFLFSQGKCIKSQSFNLFYYRTQQFKILFAASKYLDTHVKKNKAKRLLRELFRKNKNLFPKNLTFAIVAKKQVLIKKYALLETEFFQLANSVFR